MKRLIHNNVTDHGGKNFVVFIIVRARSCFTLWSFSLIHKCNFGKQINKLPVIVISRLFLIKELLD